MKPAVAPIQSGTVRVIAVHEYQGRTGPYWHVCGNFDLDSSSTLYDVVLVTWNALKASLCQRARELGRPLNMSWKPKAPYHPELVGVRWPGAGMGDAS